MVDICASKIESYENEADKFDFNSSKPFIAARMYIEDGKSIEEIARTVRATTDVVEYWKQRGVGTQGFDWDLVKAATEGKFVLRNSEQIVDELRNMSKETLKLLLERFRSGKARASFSDLASVGKFILEIENVDQKQFEFMKTLIREVARVLAKYVKDARTLAIIGLELDAIVSRLVNELNILPYNDFYGNIKELNGTSAVTDRPTDLESEQRNEDATGSN